MRKPKAKTPDPEPLPPTQRNDAAFVEAMGGKVDLFPVFEASMLDAVRLVKDWSDPRYLRCLQEQAVFASNKLNANKNARCYA